MRKRRFNSPIALTIMAAVIFGLSVAWGGSFFASGFGSVEASHAGGMDAMSIDMITTGNTASGQPAGHTEVLGALESCARINENDTMDADETAADTLTIDVTAVNIPASNPAIGFAYEFNFPDASVLVATEDQNFLLRALPGSALYAGLSDSLPDSVSPWNSVAVDGGPIPATSESAGTGTGSGVLNRLTIQTFAGSASGLFPLTLSGNAHVDESSIGHTPDVTNNAQVAVNQPCPLPPVDIQLVSLSLTSVNPTEPVGTNFALTVQGTAQNLGPNPADIRFDLGIAAPGDCTLTPPGNQTEDFLNVLPAENRTSTRIWTANCSTTSTHVFSGSGTVSVTGLAEETTPANNGPLTDPETVGITGEADVKVTNAAVNAPPDAATGEPFPVDVTVTLHNNGPLTAVNVDTTMDLQVPAGCSRVPNNSQLADNTLLAISTPVNVTRTWTVSCTTTGLKTFTGMADGVIDQLHTSDPAPGNNAGQGQDSTDTSLGVADVKVTTVAVVAPASAAVNTNFPVTVSTTVHNNGPFFPVNVDITQTINLPADCFTPVTTVVFQNASLGPSIAAQLPDVTFYVACVNHSFHNITATGTIVIDDPLAGDPNPGNNTQTSAASTTAITRTADFKVSGVILGTPASGNTGVPFNVTVDAAVHNNGPDSGPADATVALTMPADCTTPVNPQTVLVTLAPSVATPMPTQTFVVTCTTESFHNFEATVTLTPPLHVIDPSPGSNNAAGGPVTVPVIGLSDLKLAAVVAGGPPSASPGVPFNVSSTVTVHNNGPFGPTNGDVTVTLSLPADCTTPDPNPQLFTNVSLPVSTAASFVATWSVTCTDKSSHSFTANASVAANQAHVDDPTPGNNAAASAAAVVAVIASADGKITGATVVSPPAFIASNTNVPITVRTVIHNNGPFGPATFNLTRSITPVAGCTVTPPAASSHSLAASTPITVDAIWVVNCVPGTYTFNFANVLTVDDLHVADPAPGNDTGVAQATISADTDGDGIPDPIEVGCGSDPLNGASIPERIDGIYAGADDDLDAAIDEALPAGATAFDCDRDGYKGTVENHLYSPNTQGDQDPCGSNVIPPTVPATAIGWPTDLQGGGIPDSTNKVNVLDIVSFLAPVRYLNTNVGTQSGDLRWDLVPGAGIFPFTINVEDIVNLVVVAPPMLGGVRAFNGPSCPFPP